MAIDSAPDLGKPIAPLQELGLQDEKQGLEALPGNQAQAPEGEVGPTRPPVEVDASGRIALDAPIPGQSLTNDPNSPYPFERPPKYTSVEEAKYALFRGLTSENGLESITELLASSLPLEDIAGVIVFELFRTGLVNPDMMLLLTEPTILLLLFLAEYLDLEAVVAKKIEEEVEEDLEQGIADMMKALTPEDGELLTESDVQIDLQQAVINMNDVDIIEDNSNNTTEEEVSLNGI